MAGIGTVIGHNDQFVGTGTEFIFEDQQIHGTEPDDAGDFSTQAMEFLSDRHGDRAAHTAADDTDLFDSFCFSRFAQRPHKILDIFTFVFVIKQFGRCADDLEDDLYGAFFGVGTGNCERDPFAFFVDTEDDELTRFRLSGDQRSFDLHLGNGGIQFPLPYDLIHITISFPLLGKLFYRFNQDPVVIKSQI